MSRALSLKNQRIGQVNETFSARKRGDLRVTNSENLVPEHQHVVRFL